MKAIRGLALLIVLIFLQLLAVLGLYALQMAWVEHKQIQAVYHQHVNQNYTEFVLQKIEKKIIQSLPHCIIPITPTIDLIKHPISWWQTGVSCAGNFEAFKYYYVVEWLGVDPCAYIAVAPKNIVAAYIRITVLGIMGEAKTLFQSTVIKPNSEGFFQCEGKSHSVVMGRQMWREI